MEGGSTRSEYDATVREAAWAAAARTQAAAAVIRYELVATLTLYDDFIPADQAVSSSRVVAMPLTTFIVPADACVAFRIGPRGGDKQQRNGERSEDTFT